ncbi:MAG: NAD(P)-binding domain-containing protein [Myxococcota bacterium]|nr:NAD(P)-binding domain-containing protein [Myxococcota bacterium]
MSRWGLIGDGRWGQALGKRLFANGAEVMMAGLLPRKRAIKGMKYTTSLSDLLEACERIIISVPIDALEAMLASAGPHLRGDHRILTTTRGLTPETHLRGTEAIRQMTAIRQLAVLAGAADAEALKKGSPVALVVGTAFPSWAREIQNALTSKSLRVYTNRDLVGVELANVVATVVGVALGIARSLGVGPAAEATAVTRALAEMNRVISGLGGRPGTAYGLAGLGVLGEILYDGTGAAMKAGQALADGDRAKARGFTEVRASAETLASRVERHRIRAPLVEVVRALFRGQIEADEALSQLMERPVGPEGH